MHFLELAFRRIRQKINSPKTDRFVEISSKPTVSRNRSISARCEQRLSLQIARNIPDLADLASSSDDVRGRPAERRSLATQRSPPSQHHPSNLCPEGKIYPPPPPPQSAGGVPRARSQSSRRGADTQWRAAVGTVLAPERCASASASDSAALDSRARPTVTLTRVCLSVRPSVRASVRL